MGYALVIGTCARCGKVFSFNPNKVPSVRDKDNVRQPICLECVTWANTERGKMHMPLFTILPDAYEACHEEELGGDD